jgi:uncharacterized phage protein gp47/JayE
VLIPAHTILENGAVVSPVSLTSVSTQLAFETLDDITSTDIPVNGAIRALDPGALGNLPEGSSLTASPPVPGLISVTVVGLTGGTDTETDDELRARILKRIQQPPMGGSATDYEQWALAVPGVTRAWASPNEMGIGTVTIRFLMDDLRADNDGWPEPEDIEAVAAYIDTVRPVTVKDCYVCAPVKQFIDVYINNLNPNTDEVKAEIEAALRDMLKIQAAPGQTIFAAWVSYAIMNCPSVISFQLASGDFVMANPGNMAVLGTIYYDEPVVP